MCVLDVSEVGGGECVGEGEGAYWWGVECSSVYLCDNKILDRVSMCGGPDIAA